MKDGTAAAAQHELSRQDVYEHYVNCYVHMCTEVRPCQDPGLLQKAAQYVLRDPEPEGTFSVFPFYQVVREGCEALNTDCRKHLSAFIKATELLETLCINLFLQPWKKEIKTLKTFTGPFVYCLLPVLNSSTIKSVLASIGYLPHTDASQSEFRLSEDASAERAMLVGFELLLARVKCYHLIELLDKDQLRPQEWLEVLRKREQPTEGMEQMKKKTTTKKKQEEDEKKKETLDKKEASLYLDTRNVVNPQPKPRRSHLFSADQSIMEMQKTYDDLAFRGRPLIPDKPRKAQSSMSGSGGTSAAEALKRLSKKSTKAASTTVHSGSDGQKVDEVDNDDGRSGACNERNSGGTAGPGDAMCSSVSNTDGGGADDGLSGPQAISLHITLRAAPTAEQSLTPGEPEPTAEPNVWTEQQADLQSKRLAKPQFPSLSSMDEEEKQLRELAERMGQLQVQENKDMGTRKEENMTEEENTNKEKRKKGRKTSTEAEIQNLRKQVMETGPAHDASRCTRASQSDVTAIKEQKQPSLYQPSLLSDSTADSQGRKEDGSIDQQEDDDPEREGRGPMAQSFVIL